MATMALLNMTGCSNKIVTPNIKPVKYIPAKLKKCGTLKYEKQGNKLILDYKVAKCLHNNLIQCCKDKKALYIANKANIKNIELLKSK
jgi:hypothetical protein